MSAGPKRLKTLTELNRFRAFAASIAPRAMDLADELDPKRDVLGLGDLEGLAVVYLTRIYKAAHDLETLMLNEADLVRSRRAAR